MSSKLYVLVGDYSADDYNILGVYTTALRAGTAKTDAETAGHKDLAVWPVKPNTDLWAACKGETHHRESDEPWADIEVCPVCGLGVRVAAVNAP